MHNKKANNTAQNKNTNNTAQNKKYKQYSAKQKILYIINISNIR